MINWENCGIRHLTLFSYNYKKNLITVTLIRWLYPRFRDTTFLVLMFLKLKMRFNSVYFPGSFNSSRACKVGQKGIEKKPLEVHRQTSLNIRTPGGVHDDHSPLSAIQLYAPQTTGIQVPSASLLTIGKWSGYHSNLMYCTDSIYYSCLISHLAQGFVIPTFQT